MFVHTFDVRGQRIDLTGQRFDRLLVLGRAPRGKSYDTRWVCLCDCGKKKIVYGLALRNGSTKSCGCYIKDVMRTNRVRKDPRPRRHAAYEGTREYTSWVAAKSRCYNPRHHKRHRYGGRGISMHPEWRRSFKAFLRDMGLCPEGHSLDRFPNPDGNYEPGNCRWATPEQQANNKSKVVDTHPNG